MERKSILDARRSKLISEKGFDSIEYIQQLVSDTKEVMGLQKDAIEGVTNQTSILGDIL